MIKIEKKDRIVHLIISQPPVNVLDTKLLKELSGHLKSFSSDENIAAIFLSGEGKCFSAGASVEDHREEYAEGILSALLEVCQRLAQFPVPTVALVHGSCLGGALEAIAFCDLVVADPSAKFGVPEISLAFFPPFACYQFSRITGRQNAAHLIFTGEIVDAERAQAMGLVQKILKKDEWKRMEDQFNALSLPVVRLAKQAFLQGTEPFQKTLLKTLTDLFLQRLYKIEDVEEGILSFKEKRKPVWKHR